MSEEKYRFVVEWFDPNMQQNRQFLLSFYPSDSSVDMYDTTTKKLFLRRMKCDTVDINDLFVGGAINVLSRQLFIVDVGDKKTADKFLVDTESSILIVNESGFSQLGRIIAVFERNDLFINRGKIMDRDRSGISTSSMAEDITQRFAVFELRGQNSKNIVRKLLDPDAPINRPLTSALNELKEHCMGPQNIDKVDRELKLFFPSSREVHCNTILFANSTCCIIKPHAVREKLVGRLIQDIIDAGFNISAFEVITFNLANASEFLEVYKGVVDEYKGMVAQLMSGLCIALEVTKSSGNAHSEFRTYVGPADPDIAKKLRPGTLRATYGQDKIKNAVHCTDLPEDVILELEYVFKVLPA